MKRSNQLLVQSAAVGAILLMITLGGSVAVTTRPASWVILNNPDQVQHQYDLSGLAKYYNTTLTLLGTGTFANATLLLRTFHFVNIPANVNRTALAANSDLSNVSASTQAAISFLGKASGSISQRQYLNASALVVAGCEQLIAASNSFADFTGPQTARLSSLSVPTQLYSPGASLVVAEINNLSNECNLLKAELAQTGGSLTISTPQTAVETGGPVTLQGSLTLNQKGVPAQVVYFYLNGSYFGALTTDASGHLGGVLKIPFVYAPLGVIQALAQRNASAGLGGAASNLLTLKILFNQTMIVLGDPPAYLPTFSFSVQGNLTTVQGVPLPNAPVRVTFIHTSTLTTTNGKGVFGARFTVPANASDGTYTVSAAFSPQGVFGPSFNVTTIQVIHQPLTLVLNAPKTSLAGFPTGVSGTATANKTAVQHAVVTLNTPWGSYTTLTDKSGAFSISFSASALEFAFSRQVSVTAKAPEPFVATGKAAATMGIFNILIIILPAFGLGVVAFEAEQLGVFSRKRRIEAETEALLSQAGASEAQAKEAPEAVLLYRRALALAASRFGLKFKVSDTFREAIRRLGDSGEEKEREAFARILLTSEDFLYARTFDESRLHGARDDLKALEEAWK